MAQNRRRKEREIIARMKNEMIGQNGNIPTDEEVATIKSLLALPHRTEEDWCVIKDIFDRRNLICMEPGADGTGIEVFEHFTVRNGRLLAFTNLEDAMAYMKEIVPKGRGFIPFQFGTRPFLEAFEIADEESMELYIDPPTEERITEKYIVYKDEQLRAVLAFNPAMAKVMRRLMKLREEALSEADGEQRDQEMPDNQKPHEE